MTVLAQRVTRPMQTGSPWRGLPARQQPDWPDPDALAAAVCQLRALPPLVLASECDTLRERLAQAASGQGFVLMGGDCAETFSGVTVDDIRDRVKTVLQMSAVLTYGTGVPVVKIGRLAGQFAKPRSSGSEERDGVTLPVYRGDIVNAVEFTAAARRPDPSRLVRAYLSSATTLNLVRALAQGGFADMRAVQAWNRGFTANPAFVRYERVAREIGKALRFMSACGSDFEALGRTDVYAGHEALVLDYEDALARPVAPPSSRIYAGSGHFIWVGERTRQLGGAHLAFAAAIGNPVGVKIGPAVTPDELLELIDVVNPDRVPGRLTLIVRLGADRVAGTLPALLHAVARSGHPVLWVCDPMHGNTVTARDGRKTRRFDAIAREVEEFFTAHREAGTVPGGIHVELTGSDVTECVGGSAGVTEDALADRYHTACDPRLNHQQSLELAFLVAELLDRN